MAEDGNGMSGSDRSKALRTAVVTGASAGIGRELVRQLVLDRGMTVLATARRLDRLETLGAEFAPGKVHILAGDLAHADFRARLWAHAESLFADGIDLLVNNAGLGNYGAFAEQSVVEIRKMVELNLVALMDLTQYAIRHMKPRGFGQILEISSVLGYVGLPYSAVYAATKHAVNGLVKSLRYELRGTGVRVWAACPGRTESEFFSVAVGGEPAHARGPKGEPTDKIVRAIVRGLDRNSGFVLPSPAAWAIVRFSQWLPWPFDWAVGRVAPGRFREIIDRERQVDTR
jgi:short-subunit dehydrogenase